MSPETLIDAATALLVAAAALALGGTALALRRLLRRLERPQPLALNAAELEQALAELEPAPPPRRKCEIRRYRFSDGSEYVAHTLACDGYEATEDAARAARPELELLEVVGGKTHELD